MKKLLIIAGMAAIGVGVLSCGSDKRSTGRVYMPDMAYSRAYEAYGYNNIGDYERLHKEGVNYTSMPVEGTVARGDMLSYHITGDSAGMNAAQSLKNPFDTVNNKVQLKEAERLYLVNCGICHGSKLDGNGPLWKNGDGPYPAAPKNLMAADSKGFADGHYYHVITFGKGQMGSYASQLRPEQRWWVIKYIRSKQGPTAAATTDSTATASKATATDSTKTSK
ncbi:MAG: cytochrome c [Chitinophagaceae bacterium]